MDMRAKLTESPLFLFETQHHSKSPKLQIIFTQAAIMTDVRY